MSMLEPMTDSSRSPATHVHRRLGLHHVAHLRAIAEGIPVIDSALRYLDADTHAEAIAAHNNVVLKVRVVAKRRGLKRWRLIGLRIIAKRAADLPSLDEFRDQEGLDDWSEADVREMYAERFSDVLEQTRLKQVRRESLRKQQLSLYQEIQALDAQAPNTDEPIGAWFTPATTDRLAVGGVSTLHDLVVAIRGARRTWFARCPAIGTGKAHAIESMLRALLPDVSLEPTNEFEGSIAAGLPALPMTQMLSTSVPAAIEINVASVAIVTGIDKPTEVVASSLLNASTDVDAVKLWISARAGSVASKKAYEKESRRMLLWLNRERPGVSLRTMSVDDCRSYMVFLQHIPERWMATSNASPMTQGWAPFRGQLSHRSQQFALTVISGMFKWLAAARYLQADPWLLVNLNTGDDRNAIPGQSKALSEGAMSEVLDFIDRQPPSTSRVRIRFICVFMEAVGLRSTELLKANLADFIRQDEGLFLKVHGKGAKNRMAFIPAQAKAALDEYLATRGSPSYGEQVPALPLLGSINDHTQPITYRPLHKHVTGWLRKAIMAASIGEAERERLSRVSTHWLRHTFGTRAVAGDMPMDVVQRQLGHASINTTMNTYARAPFERQADEMNKVFG